jgi:two-component system LytT family response regulator
MKIRTLVVDDEPLARLRLRRLLEAEGDIELICECADGQQAVTHLQQQKPDLVFLDVQMPLLDGFEVLKSLEPRLMPVVIFVTAYDRYALRAFEVHALDYLLKPFDRDRFGKALDRARAQVGREHNENASQRLLALLEDVKGARMPAKRLVVKSGSRVSFVRIEEIDWIEAAGNYVRLHVGNDIHLLRETMSRLEARLDARMFLRIHRSTMVNVERIHELHPSFHGDYVVVLRDGTELALSRGYRENLREQLDDSV